jgi:hypothetical protein
MYVFDHLNILVLFGMTTENRGMYLMDIVDSYMVPCCQLCRYIGYLLEGL